MHKVIVAATITSALVFNASYADDAIVEPAIAPPVASVAAYDWTGLYVGGSLGYGSGSYFGFDVVRDIGRSPDVAVDDFLYGGLIGYNLQYDNLVLGVEADIQNGPKGTIPQATTPVIGWRCFSGACNTDINYWGSVRGRVGIAANEWLFYGTGGLAYGEVEGGIFNSAQQGGGWADGWAAGGGIEWGFQNWSARIEYLHVDLGDIPFGVDEDGDPFAGDGDFDVVRGALTYRFNFLNP